VERVATVADHVHHISEESVSGKRGSGCVVSTAGA
jgi:hypothetical protein